MLNTTASAGETSQMTAVFTRPPRNKAGGVRCSGLGPGHPAADGATPQVTRTGMGRRWDSTNTSPTKPTSADTWLCLRAGLLHKGMKVPRCPQRRNHPHHVPAGAAEPAVALQEALSSLTTQQAGGRKGNPGPAHPRRASLCQQTPCQGWLAAGEPPPHAMPHLPG